MKRGAVYALAGRGTTEVEYDDQAPCHVCGLPVLEASVGGTALCPWCDSGMFRDGERWTARDAIDTERVRRRAQLKHNASGPLPDLLDVGEV